MLTSGNNDLLVQFYEKNIEDISSDFLSFLKKLKDNWNVVSMPNLGSAKDNVVRVFQTMKIQIQTLFKENEKLNKTLLEFRRSDRMNYVYKNVINKFGVQIDYNRK